MARMPYRDLTTAPEEVQKLVATFAPLNVFRMLAHADTLLRGFGHLGAAILGRATLDARLRELAILRVAARSPAPYEWQQHVPIARARGASDAEIAALERGERDAPCFGERERALLRFTDDLLAGPRASDETLAAMRARFTDREVCEAILTVGYYMMVARVLETTGVELEVGSAATVTEMAERVHRR
jgi:4-carboxymuconolactone decarboxylase